MAMKWLREVHNIDIDITAEIFPTKPHVRVYVPMISTYKSLKGNTHLCKNRAGLHYKDDDGIVRVMPYCNTYEETVEVTLKYILENLI